MRLKLTDGAIDSVSASPYRVGNLLHDAELTFSIRFPPDDCSDVQERTNTLLNMMGKRVTVILEDSGGEVVINNA